MSDLPADLHPYVSDTSLWSFDPAAYGSRDRAWFDEGYEIRCYHDGPDHRWEVLASSTSTVIAHGTERSLHAARARALRVMHGFRVSLGTLP